MSDTSSKSLVDALAAYMMLDCEGQKTFHNKLDVVDKFVIFKASSPLHEAMAIIRGYRESLVEARESTVAVDMAYKLLKESSEVLQRLTQ